MSKLAREEGLVGSWVTAISCLVMGLEVEMEMDFILSKLRSRPSSP
jgi:hypothetical protein